MTGDRIWNQPFSEASLLAALPGIWERTLVLGGDDDRGEAPGRARVTFQKAESYGPLLLVIGPEVEATAFERFHALKGQFQHGFLVTVICDGPVSAAMERPVLAALIDEADEVLVIGMAEEAQGDIASNPRLHRIDAAEAVAGILRAMRELGIADAHTADRVLPARHRFLPGRSAASQRRGRLPVSFPAGAGR